MKKTLIFTILCTNFSAISAQYNVIVTEQHNKYKSEIALIDTGEYSCSTLNPLNENIYKDSTFTQTQSDCVGKFLDDNGDEVLIPIPNKSEEAIGELVLNNCLSILEQNHSRGDDIYEIYHNDTTMNVLCDMTTDGGGWTQIHQENTNFGTLIAHVDIDDKDFNYSEILYKDEGSLSDFSTPTTNSAWDWSGVHTSRNKIKFDNIWYYKEPVQLNDVTGAYDYDATVLDDSHYEILSESNICLNGISENHHQCADILKVQVPVGTKITAFSDTQSIQVAHLDNNYMDWNFSIYIRK